jgi:hypothetical protein
MSEKTKKDIILDFLKDYAACEDAIQPFKDQMKDLKKTYVDEKGLSKDDVRNTLKAYQMLKSDVDFDALTDVYEAVLSNFTDDEDSE